jgi:hypothetical protein
MPKLIEAIVVIAGMGFAEERDPSGKLVTRDEFIETDIVRVELEAKDAKAFAEHVRAFPRAVNTERLVADEKD